LLRPPKLLYAFQVMFDARTAIVAWGVFGATIQGKEKKRPDSVFA